MRRPSYPQVALLALVCCLGVGLFWGLSTSGVAYGPYNYDWDGGSDLRQTAGDGAETRVALSTAAYGDTPPEETVAVVVAPGDRYAPSERAALGSFVSRGGTLVVLSDDNASNRLLTDLGTTVRVDGRPVRDERSNFRDPAFPRATEVSNHTLVRGVDELTLNHGTVLDPGEATALVNTSTLSYLDTNRNGELDANERLASRSVAAVEEVGAGEVVVVSDASVVTNAMLDRGGNRRFLRNAVADHEHALLDYSQQGSLPALSYLFLVLRATPLLQALGGAVGLGLIALWGQVGLRRRVDRLWTRLRGQGEQARPTTPDAVDPDTLSAYLARRHPEWDDERIERVTKAIIRQREQEGSNE